MVNFTEVCDGASDTGVLAACSLNDDFGSSKEGLNTFFLIFAGALVFLMQAGFAMLCAGSVREKNVKNIMLKNLLDACGGAIGFYSVGFAFAYGDEEDPDSWIGIGNWGIELTTDGYSYAGFFFQFAFAATAATIVAGTVAERCKMSAYICYSLFLTGFVYPVVVHAIWDAEGYLTAFRDDPYKGVGNIDFAGSGVVHMTGGLTALIAATILGPRIGRFTDEDGNVLETPRDFPPHSVALQVLGTFILWFGWYGFNPGSALMIDNADSAYTAGLSAVTTTLAAASGCVVSMFTDSILVAMQTGEVSYDLTCAMNGCLSGLVAITAGCSVVDPWASVVIGGVGGWVYLIFSKLLISLKIDDAVDAIPVHFANGFWGVLAVGLFANGEHMKPAGYNDRYQGIFFMLDKRDGDLEDGDWNLLICQLVALGSIMAWVCATMIPFFTILKVLGMFRVDVEEETIGLDLSHHRGAAYDLGGVKKEDVDGMLAEVRASQHGGKILLPTKDAEDDDDKGFARKQLEDDEF